MFSLHGNGKFTVDKRKTRVNQLVLFKNFYTDKEGLMAGNSKFTRAILKLAVTRLVLSGLHCRSESYVPQPCYSLHPHSEKSKLVVTATAIP